MLELAAVRHGTIQATLMNLIPHRGEPQEGTDHRALEEQLFHKLPAAFFSGVTVLRRGGLLTGLAVHLSGRLTHLTLDERQGRAAVQALRADQSVQQFTSKRVPHPLLLAAMSLLDGELLGSWMRPTAQDVVNLTANLPATFTGTLAWTGPQPLVCIYHGGRLFTESLPPDPLRQGPLLHLRAVASPQVNLLADGQPDSAATPPAVQLRPEAVLPVGHSAQGSPATLDMKRVWQATFEVYEKRLGRAARPALEKLQQDLAGQTPEATLASIHERLRVLFGPEAVRALDDRLRN